MAASGLRIQKFTQKLSLSERVSLKSMKIARQAAPAIEAISA
jgi:hypothetical protein